MSLATHPPRASSIFRLKSVKHLRSDSHSTAVEPCRKEWSGGRTSLRRVYPRTGVGATRGHLHVTHVGVDPRRETGALINRGEAIPLFLDVVIVNRFTFPLSRVCQLPTLNQYISADKSIKSITASGPDVYLCVYRCEFASGRSNAADFNPCVLIETKTADKSALTTGNLILEIVSSSLPLVDAVALERCGTSARGC